MKTYLIVLLFINLCLNGALSQNPINELYRHEADGEHSERYGNGKTRCTYTIKNGNLTGDRISYYKNGELFCLEQFSDGKFNGTNYLLNKHSDTVYVEKYRNDTLLYTRNFSYFKSDSLYEIKTVWYENDSTLIANPFKTRNDSGGKRISLVETEEKINNYGIVMHYYESGQLHRTQEIYNGALTGAYREYYETGELKVDASSLEGEFDGVYTLYSREGKVISQETYEKGDRKK